MTLKIGDPAPDFTLPDENGQPVKLSAFKGQRVVVYFYPKDDTGGCTKQACGFRDNYKTVTEKNAVVIGISPDGATSHQKFKTKYNLPFIVVSDEDHAVAESYGVWAEKSFMGHKYWGNVRSHFIVDENGHLADVQIGVKPDASVKLALEALK